jgi:ubiquinone biosynthesis protein
LGEISFGQLLIYLFQTARRFDMRVQPSLVLLQKTLLNIEGLGRELYPQLDLWSTASPQIEEWLRQRYSPRNLLKKIKHKLPGWIEQLPEVPDQLLNRLNTPPTPVLLPASTIPPRESQRALRIALLLIVASLLYGLVPLRELPPLSWAGLALAAWLLLRADP